MYKVVATEWRRASGQRRRWDQKLSLQVLDLNRQVHDISMKRNLSERRTRSVQKNITLMQVRWQDFGNDLRAERTRRGLTYRQFAQLTGVNFSTLARLESAYTPCNTETYMTLVLEMKKDPQDYISRRAVGFADWIQQVE